MCPETRLRKNPRNVIDREGRPYGKGRDTSEFKVEIRCSRGSDGPDGVDK